MTPVPHAVLEDAVVVVTGGSRGIGAAVAMRVAQHGARVALLYRDAQESALRVQKTIAEQAGVCERFEVDVRDLESVRDVMATVEARLGAIDGLVNSAGVLSTHPFLQLAPDEWDRVIKTNLYGTYHCCLSVLPGMAARGRGRVVNLASRLGQVGSAQAAHYAASKAGVVALTKSLALEFGGNGIRVNAVAPGVVHTDMGATVAATPDGQRRAEALPLGRFAFPSEIADTILFLLTDASAMFTGQTLMPNAGEYMP